MFYWQLIRWISIGHSWIEYIVYFIHLKAMAAGSHTSIALFRTKYRNLNQTQFLGFVIFVRLSHYRPFIGYSNSDQNMILTIHCTCVMKSFIIIMEAADSKCSLCIECVHTSTNSALFLSYQYQQIFVLCLCKINCFMNNLD